MVHSNAKRTAVVAVSVPGAALAIKLQNALSEADVFLPDRCAQAGIGDASTHYWSGRISELVPPLFDRYDHLVLFGSVGMAVRLVANCIKSKRADPAMVVVDDAANFAVSVLSGHLGGANALAERVAGILGAAPVVTTASEVLGTIAVDLFGAEFDWQIEGRENITRVSAAIVNGEKVGLVQETGERNWWPAEKPLPANIARFEDLDSLIESKCEAALLISDRLLQAQYQPMPPTVIFRPRSLVIGIGCNRGASAEEIDGAIAAVMEDQGLAQPSIRNLATIDLKRDEAGLVEYAERRQLPIVFFSADDLAHRQSPNPSPVVRKWVGTPGVCEPATLLDTGAANLLVPKRISINVAIAIARIDFSTTGGV